jgi:hypothetical protein
MNLPPAEALVRIPALRSMRAPELAREGSWSVAAARAAIAAAFADLTGHAPPRAPGDDLSIDDLLVLLGRPSFVDGANNGARPMSARIVFVPTPVVLEHAIAMRPDLASAPWVRFWREMNGVSVGNGPPRGQAGDLFGDVFGGDGAVPEVLDTAIDTLPDTPGMTGLDPAYAGGGGSTGGAMAKNASKPYGTPGLYQSAPAQQWIFTILSGWSPRAYAAAVTGDENRARELIDLNAATYGTTGSPGSVSYNLKRFVIGEPLTIPKSWNAYISQDGDWGTKGKPWPVAPVTAAPPPSGASTGSTYSASLPDGTIAGIKAQLGALAAKYPAMGIVGYPGLWDMNDAIDESFRGALSKFQSWANAQTSGPPSSVVLRTDGTLDDATHARVNAWTAYSASTGTTPVAVSKDSTGGDLFTPSWPSPTGTAPPSGPDKGLTPAGSTPAFPAGSNQLASTASNSSSGGGVGALAALVVAYLASKAL